MIAGIVAGSQQAKHGSELPHRYWRLAIIGNSSNVSAIATLEMRQTAGGADVAPGNTTISSGSWTDIANLFDGSTATFGFTNSGAARGSGYSVGKDFGATSSNWPVIREIMLRNRASGGAGAESQGPTVMGVQYSDDNSNWFDAWSFSCANWSAFNTVRTFAKPSPRRKTVFNVVAPPTDAGPNALTLTANGNAAVSGGKFVFDGSGDYYSNTSAPVEVYRLPWAFTIEIDEVLATANGLVGLVCFGSASNRIIIIENNGALQIYANASGSPALSVNSVFNSTTPCNVRIRVSGSVVRFYKNGVLIGTSSVGSLGGSPISTAAVYLGADPAGFATRCLNGSFKGVRLILD